MSGAWQASRAWCASDPSLLNTCCRRCLCRRLDDFIAAHLQPLRFWRGTQTVLGWWMVLSLLWMLTAGIRGKECSGDCNLRERSACCEPHMHLGAPGPVFR